ncbi:UNVERIFIED_CONTAM: hypothetical protein Sradi_4015000 [Sesamum radiatum]|uniref:Uncharacterized protein n=1 Tax=Sesamum radiatum TaxID=300843 RepID=A0AAW2PJF1_SESRA
MTGNNTEELDGSSFDSTSLRRFIEEYYASDSDEQADSILPLLGILMYPKRSMRTPPPSPDHEYVPVDHWSFEDSNELVSKP